MPLYKGYSTRTFVQPDAATITGTTENFFGPYSVTDRNLIITDLLNHFNIRKGEKLMNPKFGCIIWDRLFDPLTPTVKNEIVNDVTELIAYDPRIAQVDKINVLESPSDNGLLLEISIIIRNSSDIVSLNLNFDGTTGVVNSTVSY